MALVDDLANIQAAISSGTLTVSYQGRTVTFRSLSELERIRNDLISQLNPDQNRMRSNPVNDRFPR